MPPWFSRFGKTPRTEGKKSTKKTKQSKPQSAGVENPTATQSKTQGPIVPEQTQPQQAIPRTSTQSLPEQPVPSTSNPTTAERIPPELRAELAALIRSFIRTGVISPPRPEPEIPALFRTPRDVPSSIFTSGTDSTPTRSVGPRRMLVYTEYHTPRARSTGASHSSQFEYDDDHDGGDDGQSHNSDGQSHNSDGNATPNHPRSDSSGSTYSTHSPPPPGALGPRSPGRHLAQLRPFARHYRTLLGADATHADDFDAVLDQLGASIRDLEAQCALISELVRVDAGYAAGESGSATEGTEGSAHGSGFSGTTQHGDSVHPPSDNGNDTDDTDTLPPSPSPAKRPDRTLRIVDFGGTVAVAGIAGRRARR